MTANERVRELRKALNLTQNEFGDRVRVSQGHLTSVETGARAVTDKFVKLLHLEFGVNEQWLISGEGEMFEDHGDEFDEIARQLNLNDLQRRLLRIVYEMPIEYQRMIRDFARQIVDSEEPENAYERDGRIVTDALRKYDEEHDEPDEEDEPGEDQQHA